MIKRFNKLISIYQKKGILSLVVYIIKYLHINIFSYSIESYYVFKKELRIYNKRYEKNTLIKIINPDDISDIKKLIKFWPEYFRFSMNDSDLQAYINKCFSNGDECFLVINNEEIIAMAWIGYSNNYMLNGMAKKINLKKDEAISHRHYVNEEHRGKKLQLHLKEYMFNYLRSEKGINTVYTYVGVHNIAGVLNNMRTNEQYMILNHISLKVLWNRINIFPGFYKEIWRIC